MLRNDLLAIVMAIDHRIWPALLLMMWMQSAAAGSDSASAFVHAGEEFRVAPTLLYAIALVESGRNTSEGLRPWPWTLNIAGTGHYFPSRKTAWLALRSVLDAGEDNVDIGPMQVSWLWHRDRLGSAWQALDPTHNVRVGAWVLANAVRAENDVWSGVGRYHSGKADRQRRYRQRVARAFGHLVRKAGL